MEKYFDLGKCLPCEVTGPDGIVYKIDGYPITGHYKGWYFKGMPISIEMEVPQEVGFSHWLINGKSVRKNRFRFTVGSKTIIEPVFHKTATENVDIFVFSDSNG